MARFIPMLAFSASFGALFGQTPLPETNVSRAARAVSQLAYRSWRSADPNLESDAANSPATMPDRSAHVAAEAGKYFDARKAYFEALGEEVAAVAQLTGNHTEQDNAADSSALSAYLAKQKELVARNLASLPQEGDVGFKELGNALQREQAALEALQATQNKAREAENSGITDGISAKLVIEIKLEAAESGRSANAWANYYQALARAATTPSSPTPPALVQVGDGLTAISGPTTNPSASAEPATIPAISSQTTSVQPAPVQSTAIASRPVSAREGGSSPIAAITSEFPLPAGTSPPAAATIVKRDEGHNAPTVNAPPSRYIGGWTYPTVGEHYHGAHPESVDLEVREGSGQISGTIKIKFHVPPNSAISPNVAFAFAGPFEAQRMQSFPFDGPDGSKGTIELIPAATFNLLEINFSSADTPGRITRGNFFLLRK